MSRLIARLLVALLSCTPGPLPAQQQPTHAPTAGGPSSPPSLMAAPAASQPVIDGRLDEPAWAAGEVATGLVQARPVPGAAASQPTEIRLLYDDHALYVAARLHDSHPDSIVAPLARRDQDVYSDWFSVSLDSYHDRRTAFTFLVNPRGVRRDLLIHDDRNSDVDWDVVWDAATRIDSAGWTAEMRIPLSQLRFDARSGEAMVWGVNFSRTIARRDELAHWSPLPPDAAGVVSRYGELHGLRGIRPSHHLEIQPYSVARMTREPGAQSNPFYRSTALAAAMGGDLRYGLTSDLTLTATLNPDFGQVEADPSEVNLSAFESYHSERRPFFTEGADLFGSWPNLFYSRRIGRAPQGVLPADAVHVDRPDATTILGAVKLTGKTAGGWSVGLLDAVTAPERVRYVDGSGAEQEAPVEPLSNYAVARISRDFRGGWSSVGGMLTATHRRLQGKEEFRFLRSAAYTGSVSARHRFGAGNYEVEGTLLGSYLRGGEEAIARVQRAPGHYFQRPDAPHLEYDPARRSLAGAASRARLARIGGGPLRWGVQGWVYSPEFEINDLGFGRNADEAGGSISVEYQRTTPGPLLRRWDVSGFYLGEWTWGGEHTTGILDLTGSAQFHNHWSTYGWIQRDFATLSAHALRGGPALVVPRTTSGYLSLRSDPRKPLSIRVSAYRSVEDETGGGMRRIGSVATYRASERAEVSLGPQLSWNTNVWQWVDAQEVAGQTRYLVGRLEQTTAALTARLDYAFSPTLSLQLYAQPFLSAGAYSRFRTVRDPRAARLTQRFRALEEEDLWVEESASGARRYRADLDGDGAPELSFGDPNFDFRQLRSNAVLRWEYRPGSTLFVVWGQERTGSGSDGLLDLGRDVGRLMDAPGTNVLLIKVSHWFGL